MALGNILRELRVERKLTQAELARALNVTPPTLSHWECNYQEPSVKDLISICDFFEISADELFERDSISPFINSTTSPYTAEEKRLIEDYRTLSPNLQKMIQNTLKTFMTSKENNRQRKI